MERQRAREKLRDEKGTDVHYLKNVILKMFETGAAMPFYTVQRITDSRCRSAGAKLLCDLAYMDQLLDSVIC